MIPCVSVWLLYMYAFQHGSQLPIAFFGYRAEQFILTLWDSMGGGGEIEQGRVNMTKIKVVPSQPVPCGVSSCMSVSVSLQILMWNPAGADRTFFEQQARSAQYGPDVEVIDSRAVTGAIESACGKWGTLQPHSLQPWGGKRERDKCRVRGKREAKQISSLHGHEDWMNKWALTVTNRMTPCVFLAGACLLVKEKYW